MNGGGMVREMTDEKEFMERNAQAAEVTRVDMEDRPRKRLTDSRAWELIRRRNNGARPFAKRRRKAYRYDRRQG